MKGLLGPLGSMAMLVRALGFPVPRTHLGTAVRDPWRRSLPSGHPGSKRYGLSPRLQRARARMKKQSQRINRANGQRERSGSQRRMRS